LLLTGFLNIWLCWLEVVLNIVPAVPRFFGKGGGNFYGIGESLTLFEASFDPLSSIFFILMVL